MILSHKRLSLTAAAVAILAAWSIFHVASFSLSSSVYALEQTVRANDGITSYHVKITPPPTTEGVAEAWIELNSDGTPSRARVDVSAGERGDRVVIVSKDRVDFWFKAKNQHAISNRKEMLQQGFAEIMRMRPLFDPKSAFQQLLADEKAARVQVARKTPDKEGEPITLTVTFKDKADRQQVYEIDSHSNLVERVVEYRRIGNKWDQVSQREYLDYNKEIDPKVFQLELPKDVLTIDMIDFKERDGGLTKAHLTENEIAAKVAREFFEALIAKDYEKAEDLFPVAPRGVLKAGFERDGLKFLRIVEIGKPTPGPAPRSLKVRVKLEMEIKGKKHVDEISPIIQAEGEQWRIVGGI